MNKEQFWLNDLLGREDDIAYLYEEYENVKKSKQPRFISLLGERGVGKTRLIRAFYEDLRIKEDKIDYWPEHFQGNYVQLDLNPDYSSHSFKDNINQKDTSFYWWGVGFTSLDDSDRVQQSQCSLLQSSGFLAIHFSFLREKELLNQDKKEALDLVGDTLLEFISGLIPGAGFIKSLIQKYIKNIEHKKETAKIKEATQEVGGLKKQKRLDDRENIFKGIGALLEDGIPMVLILDDLHWIDRESTDIIYELFKIAEERNWPLMFLSTCWTAEWYSSIENKNCHLGKLIIKLSDTTNVGIIKRDIMNISESDKILQQGLPGLPQKQQDIITEKLGADLFALNELIEYLRGNKKLFEEKNINNQLTQTGIDTITNYKYPRLNIIEARFKGFQDELQELLSYASVQGINFIEELLNDMINKEDKLTKSKEEDPRRLLEIAKNHYMFIKNTFQYAHFVEPVNYKVAHNYINQIPDDFNSIQSKTWDVIKEWVKNKKHLALTQNELLIFSQISENIYHEMKEVTKEDEHILDLLWLHRQLILSESIKKLNSDNFKRIILLLEAKDTTDATPLSLQVNWIENLLSYHYFSLNQICDRSGLLRLKDISKSLYLEMSKSLQNELLWKDIEDFKSISENMAILINKVFLNDLLEKDPFETMEEEKEYENEYFDEIRESILGNINNFSTNRSEYKLINIINYYTLYGLTTDSSNMNIYLNEIAKLIIDIDSDTLSKNKVCTLLFDGPITRTVSSLISSSEIEKNYIFNMMYHVRKSLTQDNFSNMELYPLVVLAYVTNGLAEYDAECISSELYDESFSIALELIKRGAIDIVGGWLSIGSSIRSSVGLAGKDNEVILSSGNYKMDSNHYDQIWNKTFELLTKVKEAGANENKSKLNSIYITILMSTLGTLVQSGKNTIDFYDNFLVDSKSRLHIINDIEEIAKYVWVQFNYNNATNQCDWAMSVYRTKVDISKLFIQKNHLHVSDDIKTLIQKCLSKDISLLKNLVDILVEQISDKKEKNEREWGASIEEIVSTLIGTQIRQEASKDLIQDLQEIRHDPSISIKKLDAIKSFSNHLKLKYIK